MLRRYAVAHAVYKARQRDEVRPCLVSNNQTFGYLASDTEVVSQCPGKNSPAIPGSG